MSRRAKKKRFFNIVQCFFFLLAILSVAGIFWIYLGKPYYDEILQLVLLYEEIPLVAQINEKLPLLAELDDEIPLLALLFIHCISMIFVYRNNKRKESQETVELVEQKTEENPDSEAIEEAAATEEPEVATIPVVAPVSFLNNDEPSSLLDIITAAREAMEALKPFADRQGIQMHLSTTSESLMLRAVPSSIQILFRNIIDNSIKYMGRSGHLIITISQLDEDIFLVVKDTGNGLSEQETSHVFELNFQGSNRVSGNGLGLTQSKAIVEAFGGTIYAKSSPGKGMAIYIQLPVASST